MNYPKLSCILFLLIFGSAVFVRAATVDDAIAAVIAAEKARGAALVAHDLPALEQILAEDFNYTHSTNLQETKVSHLASLRNGLHYTKFEVSELRAHVIAPGIVTLNGIFDQIKGKAGEMKAGRYLFLAVWRRSGDRWQLVALQSALPPTPAPK